jgi:signal transduction histidine kinase
MPVTGDESPRGASAQGARATHDDAELLRFASRVAGLDAAAIVVSDPEGRAVRASWPVDIAGYPLRDDPAEQAALLESAGGSGGAPLMATVPVEEGLTAALLGSVDPASSVAEDEAMASLEVLAGLIASRIGVDGARMRAEDARARMASLVDAGLSLGRQLALDDLLTRIVQAAREVVGARYAALGVLDASRTRLAEFVTAGLSEEEQAAIGDPPSGRGLLGALIRDARTLRLNRMEDDPRSAGFPPGHPPMTSFLGVPVMLRGEAFGNLYLTDKVGGGFTAEDEQIAQTFASQAAVAVDNLRRFEAESRRAGELESVLEIARAVLGTLDVEALLPLVARRARRLTGADTVGFAVADGGRLTFQYAHGVDALGLEGVRVPMEMDLLETSLRETLGAPVVVASALEVGGELAGALVAIGWRPFDIGARRLLETFSSQVAIALANARSVAAERESMKETSRREAAAARDQAAAEGLRRAVAAQESERARVARELHDEVGQVLTALAVHLRTLEDEVSTPEARRRVEDLRGSVGDAARSLRELAIRLRPARLLERGLADAIEEQADRLRAAGLEVDVDVRGITPELPEDVQTVVFRTVQESLTNISRHAGATHASVLAAASGSRLRIVVEDDGVGFDPDSPTSRLGLVGIRERVELLGGNLRIESSPGAGSAVVVDLEIPR